MDGILMITFYEHEREKGFAPVDALTPRRQPRMRPPLMTSLSACIGLFLRQFPRVSAARCSVRWPL